MIVIANKSYEVVVDHKNGWKPDAFKERFSEVLERYDYIVGDWGYNQLRMRGFFKDNHPKATKESTIATFEDYLNEYCNFGCAYFIIEKVPSKHQPLPQPSEDVEPEEQEVADLSLQEQIEELQTQEQMMPQPPSKNRHQRQNNHQRKQYNPNKQGNPKTQA
ncbi:YutD family protein [Paenibacillus agricola]|uniref:YutD family protein n=1 Tax=Paenibacillus agricola TaxID=2716264 RepID=A0ABX0JC11_9BACL|nr:YutD family protein [Paenibacillus agricola]NHN33488.1 YutD family protein [Paenibacillus agricola]